MLLGHRPGAWGERVAGRRPRNLHRCGHPRSTSQLTDADKELAARHGEPGRDWISPVGWLHTGEKSCKAWLARAEDGTVTVDMEAARHLWGLRNDRELSPDDNAAAAAAAAVLAVVGASQSGKLRVKG